MDKLSANGKYHKPEVMVELNGSVKAGTVPALVKRLTDHEHVGKQLSILVLSVDSTAVQLDSTFMTTFLMTYRSFTTVDQLFDLLVQRFYLQPPRGLEPLELENWMKLEQHVIQMR